MNKRLLNVTMIALTMAALSGCHGQVHSEAKQQAQDRWQLARAQIILGVGEEQFKTGDLDNAASSAREALALVPALLDAKVLLARVAIEKGNYSSAKRILEDCLTVAPNCAPVVYLLGVAHEKMQAMDLALASYEKARALDPTNAAYVLASAEVLVVQGKPRQAFELVEGKLATMDQSVGMYKAAAELATLVDENDKACEFWFQARCLEPEEFPTREKLAKAYFFAGRFREAVAELDYVRLHGEGEPRAWVHTLLGECYMALDQTRQARASFERVTELQPKAPQVWVNLAKAALACNDPRRAVLAANQALSLDATCVEAMLIQGYALLAEGQTQNARNLLVKAVRMHPDNAMLNCLLGWCYSQLNQPNEARQAFGRALELDPTNVIARQMLARANEGSAARNVKN